MSPAAEQVLQAALALPDEERLEMIDALLAAASAGSAHPVDEAWMAEIQRRSAEFDILHFHMDLLHFPVFRDVAARTVTLGIAANCRWRVLLALPPSV